MATTLIWVGLIVTLAPFALSSFGDDLDLPFIDEDSDLGRVMKSVATQTENAEMNMARLERSTSNEIVKDDIKMTKDMLKQSVVDALTETKNKPGSLRANLEKAQWSKLADGLSKLNDVFWKLNQSDNENVKMQAICELVGVTAQFIPPPVGIVVSVVAMIGAVIFGSTTPTDGASTRAIIRSELVFQYMKETNDLLSSEADMIDLVTNRLKINTEFEFKNSTKCQEDWSGPQMTKEQIRDHCDRSAVNEYHSGYMSDTMAKAENMGLSAMARARNLIDRESLEIDNMEKLKAIHDAFTMTAKITSLRFTMFTVMKLYIDKYMPYAKRIYEVEDKSRADEAERFEKWLQATLGGTKSATQSILALYMLRRPVPGLEVITRTISEKMNHLVPNGWLNQNLRILGECYKDGNFEELGFYDYEYGFNNHWIYVRECTEHYRKRGHMIFSEGDRQICQSGTNRLQLKPYNSADLSQGLVLSPASQPTRTWGIDYQYYVYESYKADITAFAFHPVGTVGTEKWLMMVTRGLHGKRPDRFSFVKADSDKYLVANDEDISSFTNLARMFFKFET